MISDQGLMEGFQHTVTWNWAEFSRKKSLKMAERNLLIVNYLYQLIIKVYSLNNCWQYNAKTFVTSLHAQIKIYVS